MFDLHQYLAERREVVDAALAARLPPETATPADLHAAMRYSVLVGGKRIRPILAMAAAEAVEGEADWALHAGLAVEVLHAYTLVHDDMPCMDDDALRRGQPTCHVKFGEATAILAGDALQTLAFEWVAELPAPAPHLPNALVLELARAAGSVGVVGGQAADLAAEEQVANEATLTAIHQRKTAGLIAVTCRMGAICAGADPLAVDALGAYGAHVGLAFQFADDLLDATGDTEVIGKPAGSDAERDKMTVVSVYGLERAREIGMEHVADAVAALANLPGDTQALESMARYIMERVD